MEFRLPTDRPTDQPTERPTDRPMDLALEVTCRHLKASKQVLLPQNRDPDIRTAFMKPIFKVFEIFEKNRPTNKARCRLFVGYL